MTKIKKMVLVLASAATVVAGTGYFLGVAYCQTHFKMGTTINGFECSLKSVDEVDALLQRKTESYAMAVNTRNDGVEKIDAYDVGLTFVGRSNLIDIINSQNPFLWFLPVDAKEELPAECYELDSEKMNEKIDSLKCMSDMVKGESAHVVETEGVFQVSPAIRGTELDKAMVKNVVGTALRQWRKAVDLESIGCYIDAEEVSEEELQRNCDTLNSIGDVIITYDFEDRKETIDFDKVKNNFLNKRYAISKNKIKKYVEKIAEKYDTVGVKRNFVTYDDLEKPIEGGDYGWKIDVDETAAKLYELIKSNTVDVIEPVYISGAVSRKKNDVGHSYLEIDKERGRAVFYVDGNPIVQCEAHLGDGLESGFYSMRLKEEGDGIAFGEGYVYTFDKNAGSTFSGTEDISGISSNGVADKCVALTSDDIATVLKNLHEGWPIIIY